MRIDRSTDAQCNTGRGLSTVRAFWAALAFVCGLLRGGCPSAIRSIVRAVIVLPVQGAATRTRTHVAKKGAKVVAPLATHRDSTGTIVLVVLVLLVVAPLLGSHPGVVFAAPTATMLGKPLQHQLGFQATATPCCAAQIACGGVRDLPTRARAFPVRVALTVGSATNNSQAAELKAGDITKAHRTMITQWNVTKELNKAKGVA